MPKCRRITKRDERKEMVKLMEAREKRAPERSDPAWVHRFWRQVAA
jgi:hypothetical protein